MTPSPYGSNPVPDVTSRVTPDQQHILDRIAKQRDRIQARRAARVQALALIRDPATSSGIDESFALRVMAFARQHPFAVLGIAGLSAVAGPRRLLRWAGVVLPFLMKIRR